MTINLYLDNEEETEIFSLYDIVSNPFTLNDVIHLDVEMLFPVDYGKYVPRVQNDLRERNDELLEKFRHKRIQLIRERKNSVFNVISKANITIDYYCKIIG